MPLPQPPVSLDDICSVIWNNTLYTYSQNAFQALSLTPGGNWTQLPQGEKVTGAACVGSTPTDASLAGFYVVGGKGTNADYQGLQKFTYSTGKWETITPQAPVTQQRLWHGAVYLTASDTILIYAGAQDGAQNPSSQTFTVGASAPYTVISYQSSAPPTINPILLPWSGSEAVLVGGSTTNKQIFLFKPETSWIDSGASLADPLVKDVTAIKATLVTGDDGCKNLYTFDMTQSPNAVSRTVLINGQGQPVQNSPSLSTRSETTRALTLGDWPQYNATLAPTVTRTNYALAKDSEDLVVIAGGSKDDILCMFDGRENGWQNATARLSEQKVLAADTTSTSTSQTSSTTPTSTSLLVGTSSSTTATPTAAAVPISAQENGTGLATNTLLGIIFGSVFGAAVILALIYLCIKRKRSQLAYLEAGHMRRASGVSSPEKDSIVFANDSLTRGLSGAGTFRGHQQQESGNSFSSMAILMGKVNQQNHQHPAGLKRNPSDQTKRSSSSSVFNKAFKSTISKPIPQMAETMGTAPPRPPPESRDEKGVAFAPDTAGPRSRTSNALGAADGRESTRRSSGWNRYWSGGSALNIIGFGSGNAASAVPKRMTVESDRSSEYSNVSHHRITQDSATVPPLNVYEPRASFSRVTRGSPTISHYDKEVKEGMAGQIERPVSAVSDLSGYSSGIPASVHEAWDPTMMQKPWGSDRAPSSAYTNVYPTSLAPAAQAARANQAPTGVSRQPQLATAATSSDMSWLNLGDNGGP
ncbi:hypothetical protein CONLIGDRAFT_48800 [Coniochaeta ligniaria NRRL 30616]|uniref:Pre-mRNA splicing factor CLF1 n=1 Tax=Coniochaeta ligniaria NRRL 30616 TaxID=1408157 RepID=A0A1J7JYP5_9PEZI|nr:hypothetical protein CONLIGDRAFT_48800 [Coniochaeta ligniaria NRRL 30616]